MRRSTKAIWSNAFWKGRKGSLNSTWGFSACLENQGDPLLSSKGLSGQWASVPFSLICSPACFKACFLSMYQSYLANGLVFSEKSHLPISSTLVQLSLKLLCLINCGRGRTGCVIGQLLSRELEMHHFMSCTEKGLWLQILMLKESLLRLTSFFSWSDGFM